TGAFEEPCQFVDGKNFNLCLAFFCPLHVGNWIFSYVATSLGETEKHSQSTTKGVACNRPDTQAAQPFIDSGCANSGNHLLAKSCDESAKPNAQIAQVTYRHSIGGAGP